MKKFAVLLVSAVLIFGGCAAEKQVVKPEVNKLMEEAKERNVRATNEWIESMKSSP